MQRESLSRNPLKSSGKEREVAQTIYAKKREQKKPPDNQTSLTERSQEHDECGGKSILNQRMVGRFAMVIALEMRVQHKSWYRKKGKKKDKIKKKGTISFDTTIGRKVW
jgi:hypothetical protein